MADKIGERRKEKPENVEELWSIELPKDDHDFGSILLEAGFFQNPKTGDTISFVIEDFGLGFPHSFRRRF